MSIKKEVNQLTDVYNKILLEEFEGGVNVGAPSTSINPVLDSPNVADDYSADLDDDISGIQMSDSENLFQNAPVDTSRDNNKSMAKSEVYKIVKSSNELLKMLMANDCADIEPWQLSKITKASDYVCSVKGSLEFDEFEKMAGEFNQGMEGLGSPVVVKVRDMLAGEPLSVNEEILKQVIFNIECIKEAKNVKDKKAKDCPAAKKGCKCSKCPKCKANQKKK